jgi:hypothetical protein
MDLAGHQEEVDENGGGETSNSYNLHTERLFSCHMTEQLFVVSLN